MKRSDLRVMVPAFPDAEDMPFPAPVSDDDLRTMAPELLAILLDGVDVEALRRSLRMIDDRTSDFYVQRPTFPWAAPIAAARAVLAALEGETP